MNFLGLSTAHRANGGEQEPTRRQDGREEQAKHAPRIMNTKQKVNKTWWNYILCPCSYSRMLPNKYFMKIVARITKKKKCAATNNPKRRRLDWGNDLTRWRHFSSFTIRMHTTSHTTSGNDVIIPSRVGVVQHHGREICWISLSPDNGQPRSKTAAATPSDEKREDRHWVRKWARVVKTNASNAHVRRSWMWIV